ncbi:MAG TPA: class I SAM-dependent methyltransferase [Planctomycetota bacterium]|nr:class I SAM-dependent methyltransferase [Planctomycetota bacterium]
MRWLVDRLGARQGFGSRGPGGQLIAHEVPRIFHHWEHTHVQPLLHELGVWDAATLFGHHLRDGAARTGNATPRFLSLGAGDCQLELTLAKAFVKGGLRTFTIDCVEPDLLLRGRARASALAQGLEQHVVGVAADLNTWSARHRYDGVMANGSLHRVVRLERLLDGVQKVMADGAWFVVRARIGRNGHLRWPEALAEVHQLWQDLPPSHRWDHHLRRSQQTFTDWDNSRIGDDGVRAQDVLPELLERFSMPLFAGFGNLIDVFVGTAFGPNFSPESAWDRDFIASVHERDEELLTAGRLTPTHMFAVMARGAEPVRAQARGLRPEQCVRQRR